MSHLIIDIILPRINIVVLRRILALSHRLMLQRNNEWLWYHHLHHRIPRRHDDAIIDRSAVFGVGIPKRWLRYAILYSPKPATKVYELQDMRTPGGIVKETAFAPINFDVQKKLDEFFEKYNNLPSKRDGSYYKQKRFLDKEKARLQQELHNEPQRGIIDCRSGVIDGTHVLYSDGLCESRGENYVFSRFNEIIGLASGKNQIVWFTADTVIYSDRERYTVPNNRIIDYIYITWNLELILLANGELMFSVVEEFDPLIGKEKQPRVFHPVQAPERYLKCVELGDEIAGFITVEGKFVIYRLTVVNNELVFEKNKRWMYDWYLAREEPQPFVEVVATVDQYLMKDRTERSILAIDSSGRCFGWGDNPFNILARSSQYDRPDYDSSWKRLQFMKSTANVLSTDLCYHNSTFVLSDGSAYFSGYSALTETNKTREQLQRSVTEGGPKYIDLPGVLFARSFNTYHVLLFTAS